MFQMDLATLIPWKSVDFNTRPVPKLSPSNPVEMVTGIEINGRQLIDRDVDEVLK